MAARGLSVGGLRGSGAQDEHGDVASPEQVRAFTEAMPPHLQIAIPLAAWCALRIGELLGLQRRDLEQLDDPRRAVLHVRRQWNVKANALTPPKADSVRTVALPEALLPALRGHLDAYTPAGRTAPVLAGLRGARVSQTGPWTRHGESLARRQAGQAFVSTTSGTPA